MAITASAMRRLRPEARAVVRELERLASAIYHGAFIWTDDDNTALEQVRAEQRLLVSCGKKGGKR
jgi:hypothetical protein